LAPNCSPLGAGRAGSGVVGGGTVVAELVVVVDDGTDEEAEVATWW
jgi:hypothetical protein